MILTLAQAAETVTTTVTSPVHRFDPGAWIPSGEQFMRGMIVSGGFLIAGGIVYFLARRYFARARITAAYLVAMASVAIYFGIGVMKPDRFRDPLDTGTFWLRRLFWGALLFVAIRLLDRLVIVPLMSRGGKVPIQRFVHQIVIIVVSLFAVLGYGSHAFGWDIDKFLAGSAVVSIVLGLALQETLGNFFSGLVMQASSPFAIGNWIVVAGVEGRVVDMNWRAVTIHTQDDNFVVIPNSTIAKEQITNFHAPTVSTACNVRIHLESELVPGEVMDTFMRAVQSAPGVLHDPTPEVRLEKFEGSTIQYGVKFWIDNPARHEDVEHDVRLALWYHMRRKGITIPYTSSTIEINSVARKGKLLEDSERGTRLQALEKMPLFAQLAVEHKQRLAEASRVVLLSAGETLFRQGDSGESFYVIHQGRVDVKIGDSPANQTTIATLGAGEFFGEMSALTGQPRTATIVACESLTLVELDKSALKSLFEADPSIMEQVSQIVSRRNAEREAAKQGLSQATPQEIVIHHKSLLGRMLRFFGRETIS